jgi:hypothetical protein
MLHLLIEHTGFLNIHTEPVGDTPHVLLGVLKIDDEL